MNLLGPCPPSGGLEVRPQAGRSEAGETLLTALVARGRGRRRGSDAACLEPAREPGGACREQQQESETGEDDQRQRDRLGVARPEPVAERLEEAAAVLPRAARARAAAGGAWAGAEARSAPAVAPVEP